MTATARLYDLALVITQKYAQAALGSRQALRLMPLNLPGEQSVIAASLSLTPPASERRHHTDFFGNSVVDVTFSGAHEEISFKLQARVRRELPSRELPLSPSLEALATEIARLRTLDPHAPHHYLPPSPRVPPVAPMAEYAHDTVNRYGQAHEAVETLGKALHRDMKFDAEATTVETPVAEAFEKRHGVCQDFSHIMIGCLRSLGIPAGYVSGFLRTIPPEGQPRLQGADAMHAWVRAWCGVETGWVEYDPTNATYANADHIVIARGRDYGDVAPVKGVLRTAGIQEASHSVDMVEVDG